MNYNQDPQDPIPSINDPLVANNLPSNSYQYEPQHLNSAPSESHPLDNSNDNLQNPFSATTSNPPLHTEEPPIHSATSHRNPFAANQPPFHSTPHQPDPFTAGPPNPIFSPNEPFAPDQSTHSNPFSTSQPTSGPSNTTFQEQSHLNNASPQPTFTPPQPAAQQQPPPRTQPPFDILEWHNAYTSCQRFFLDHGQHEAGTQALAALINILLPCQWARDAVHNSTSTSAAAAAVAAEPDPQPIDPTPQGPRPGVFFPMSNDASTNNNDTTPTFSRLVSLIPYIRRLVITANATPTVLHGLFGQQYHPGILPLVEIERRNYLFTAKSVGFARTKAAYDLPDGQTVTYLSPLKEVGREELENAEGQWSRWLAMEDWMVGDRAPNRRRRRRRREEVDGEVDAGGVRVKMEDEEM